MSYSADDMAAINRQIDDLMASNKKWKLSPEELASVFARLPDQRAGFMVMALIFTRLERAEGKLDALRKDGLAF